MINSFKDFLASEFQSFSINSSEVYPRTFTLEEKDDVEKACLNIFTIYARKCMTPLDLKKQMCYLFVTKFNQQISKEHPLFKHDDHFIKQLVEEVKIASLACGGSKELIRKHFKSTELTEFLDKLPKHVAACALMFIIRTMEKRPFIPITFGDDQWEEPVNGDAFFQVAVAHKRDPRIFKDLSTNKVYDNEGLILCSPEPDYSGWELTYHRAEITDTAKPFTRSFNIKHFTDSSYTQNVDEMAEYWLMVNSIERRALNSFHLDENGAMPLRECFSRAHLELALGIAKFHLTKDGQNGKHKWLDLETITYAINNDFCDLKEDLEVVYRFLHRHEIPEEIESTIKEMEKIFVFCDLGTPMDYHIIKKLICFMVFQTHGFEFLEFISDGVRCFNSGDSKSGNTLSISKVVSDYISHPTQALIDSIKNAHFFTVTPNFAIDGGVLPKEIQLSVDKNTKEVKYVPWNS